MLLQVSIFQAVLAAAPGPQPPTSSTTSESPPQANVFPFPIAHRQLQNGLKVVAIVYDSPGLVAYQTVAHVGSRNEIEPGKSGFAHFFEHMMFRGTERYPQQAYNAALKRMGADSNAWTWWDQTVYHILAAREALPKIVELEADRFQNLHYTEAAFQKEARAVLGEYNKNASDPSLKISEALHDAAFTKHPYKHTTMGFLADIEAMPQQFQHARDFFSRYYRPDNVSIVVVGDIDPPHVLDLIEQHYGAWQGRAQPKSIPAEPALSASKRIHIPWPAATLPRLTMGFRVPAFSPSDIDHAALETLANVAFSQKSRLYRRLVLQEQKVESLSGNNPTTIDPSLFVIEAQVKNPADLDYVQGVIRDELQRLAQEGVDAKTLADVLSHLRYDFAGELSTAQKISDVAAWYLSLAANLDAIDGFFTTLARVRNDDVKRVVRRYFIDSPGVVVTLAQKAENNG